MEKKSNHEYGQTDPDFIDQNTLVDGTNVQSDDTFKPQLNKEQNAEFEATDPDHIEQNTAIDTDNYAKDEDPYQYKQEFIEDFKHPENDLEKNKNSQTDQTVSNKNSVPNDDEKK